MLTRRALLSGGAALAGAGLMRPRPAAAHPDDPDPARLVDPRIGTGGHGHTFPGAVVPFGMVALSPDNGVSGWDWCSGYHWSSDVIAGFSHTHLSGTGIGDLCDVLVTPLVGDEPMPRPAPARFRHADEAAAPGYYRVRLAESGILAELTATERVGVHRYTFPPGAPAALLLDLGFAVNWDRPTETAIALAGPSSLAGRRFSTGWARDQRVCFVLECSRPFTAHALADGDGDAAASGAIEGPRARACLRFAPSGEPLVVRVGLSAVDVDGARANLRAEVGDFDFDAVRDRARAAWNAALGRLRVTTPDADLATVLHTALYHALIHPSLACDADGRYRGPDGAVHEGGGHRRHTVFSLWDTYRAEHPLLTLVQPERVDDLVQSMLGFGREFGRLPVWELCGNETNTMIGYHAVPPIVEAWGKRLTRADPRETLDQLVRAATTDGDRPGFQRTGLRYYAPPPVRTLEALVDEDAPGGLRDVQPMDDAVVGAGPLLPGWARTVAGEAIGYESVDPTARSALLVRARDGDAITWVTDPLPDASRHQGARYVWLAAMDARPDGRRFDVTINGARAFSVTSPVPGQRRVEARGERGERFSFVGTHEDRHGDLQGYAFLVLPAGHTAPGEGLTVRVAGEAAGSDAWLMVFQHRVEPSLRARQRHALVATPDGMRMAVRLDIQHTGVAQPAEIRLGDQVVEADLVFGANRLFVGVPPVARRTPLPITVRVGDAIAGSMNLMLRQPAALTWVPADEEGESVSKALEYAYDDACIAAMAAAGGRADVASAFTRRAAYYRGLYDPESGFMRGRNADGSWVRPFSPLRGGHLQPEYTEGNAWQYSWSVQHDAAGLAALLGGRDALVRRLDALFDQPSVAGEGAPPDVTGLIGQYAHGNEPSHHVAYLYACAGAPWKTQERVRRIATTLYRTGPEGLCGNDDCGQISAWFLFSALGFYPVDPASGVYVLGTPLVEEAVLALPQERRFTVRAPGVSAERRWVTGARLNGRPLTRAWIAHEEIAAGGTLEFAMGTAPSRTWATGAATAPPAVLARARGWRSR
jgi:putative alpha-1,2-mannosidase